MSREFFTIAEAALAAGSDFFPKQYADIPMSQDFRCDSRNVGTGDVFVALPGERDDGHNYISESAQAGASCVMLDSSYFDTHREELLGLGTILMPVPNSSLALSKLARAWLDLVSPKVAGITGSVGKTTTREFLRASAGGSFRTHSAGKSYNTMTGCGMTILSMPGDTEVLVLELGTSHIGDIEELVRNFPVTHGIITEAAPAHLEGLRDLDGVVEAKMEIVKSGSIEFLSYNSDNENLAAAVSKYMKGLRDGGGRVRAVGVGYSDSGVRIMNVRQSVSEDMTPKLSMIISRGDRKFQCEARVFGRQHARNIAFAYAASSQLGVGDDDFISSAASFRIPSGRGVLSRAVGGGILVDETYNANPASVSHALKNVLELELAPEFKRIAILGGMRELGDASPRWHEIIMSRAALLDEVYLIGGEWPETWRKHDSIKGMWETAGDFMANFGSGGVPKSITLIKGSRFYGLDRLIERFEEKRHDD
ncbi:MAG: Mur ligase domain-containing protein [Synergistaceae bacterium]|jgi:UDP-N-acetylmuramoyl-tripeptide--D-alanyl-D-alanine ligase|nr:Mur ligase domain-containing protein [Synergistaceae bacterium]